MLPTRHRVHYLTPGQLAPHPTLPWASGGTVPRGGQRGGADRDLAAWALSAVLIRPPHPCSPSGRRVPGISLLAPSQSQLHEFGGPLGSLGPAPGAPGVSPSPDRGAASLPSPPPRPLPLPASPRSLLLPPYRSRPPPSSPLRLVRQFRSRCWVFTPGGLPGRPLSALEPPRARALPPCSLAAADGATAGAGAAEPRAQLARGRRAPPPPSPARTQGSSGL